MKPLFTDEEFLKAKSRDMLPCECYKCNKKFYKVKYDIQKSIKNNKNHKTMYCSNECRITKQKTNCTNCGIVIFKNLSEIKKSKSNNYFCSKSCSVKYNNKHKNYGYRRSKLENWLENQLTLLYPDLEIDYNKKTIINSELDIYIPSLNIAFELNGIYHYEPIYGVDKLNQIKENDISKSKLCYDHKIDLCIINTTEQKYFKPSTSHKYLDIIVNIIKERLKG